MITKEQKMNLYIDLLSELNKSEIYFEQDDLEKMVSVQVDSNKIAYVEVYKDYYISGVANYDSSNNFWEFSNVGCPDFYDAPSATDWLIIANKMGV